MNNFLYFRKFKNVTNEIVRNVVFLCIYVYCNYKHVFFSSFYYLLIAVLCYMLGIVIHGYTLGLFPHDLSLPLLIKICWTLKCRSVDAKRSSRLNKATPSHPLYYINHKEILLPWEVRIFYEPLNIFNYWSISNNWFKSFFLWNLLRTIFWWHFLFSKQ